MHTAKAIWKQDLLFDGYVDEKNQIPLSLGNTEDTISPMGLLMGALAACTGMDVISILKKKRQEVTAFEVAVEGEQADEHPKVYKQVRIVYRVTGVNIDEKAVARAIELSTTRYCGVHATLEGVGEVESRYEIIEQN